jgi:hypothetical protein
MCYPNDDVVSGVHIFLSVDEGKSPISTRYETWSDEDGNYQINVTDIPQAANQKGAYYIVAEKDGYQTLRETLAIGPFAPYTHNTIVLAPFVRQKGD